MIRILKQVCFFFLNKTWNTAGTKEKALWSYYHTAPCRKKRMEHPSFGFLNFFLLYVLNCHVILCIQIWFLYLHKLYLLCFCMKNHSVPFSTFNFGQLIICNFLNGLYLVEIVLYSLLFWKHFKVTIWSLFYFVFSFLCSFFIFLLVLRMELRASYQVNHSNRCMAFYFFRKILTFRTSSQLNNFPDFFFF